MKKNEIIEELADIAARLGDISVECACSFKGCSDGAAELAALAVCHLIDLVRAAVEVSE